ncbi:HAMP domain-containing histidine kinase [Acidiferrimicrobium sp. IK]|uniref:sensor histidine kinase n=1 Tax=Acidiferrimicrobium sp. IK TaxID=2871700 RepID=UPI0021CB0E8D|nr:HAMP domain-containing sensor histidine kinase [Acidiferrimicrobium sp. IK]MCU4187002.1 HAMP domain-containing histidine kinase [Acidiferrimicrobium sp. IK]
MRPAQGRLRHALNRGHRRHAIKVALVATALTALLAVVIGAALDVIVLRHLRAEADSRLADRVQSILAKGPLDAASPRPLTGTTDGDGDFDDAPALVWLVTADGHSTALIRGAPALPVRPWRSGAVVSLHIGTLSLRARAQSVLDGWVVVAESVGQIDRVRGELVVTELLLGAGLLVVVYAAALLIGLRASAPVEEVRRRQAAFTADASHELRTPLSVIQAEVGLALDRPRDGEYYRDTLRRVSDEGYRLREIVDDLLWLARSDSGSEVPPAVPVDVAGAADAAVTRFAAVAAGRGLSLDVAAADVAVIMAPAGWVDRLLGVLVDNACRYSPPGGSVLVQVVTTAGHVVLTVDDDGPGVPAEERARVFDRFHRVSDVPGGTGLGLAIADSVVRTTGGEWFIGDAPLGGARFRVTWRAVAVPTRRHAPVAG